jgi:hypothetical protein
MKKKIIVQSARRSTLAASVSSPAMGDNTAAGSDLHNPSPMNRKADARSAAALRELAMLGHVMPFNSPLADIARRISYVTGRPSPRTNTTSCANFIGAWVREVEAERRAPGGFGQWTPLKGYSLRVPDARSTRHIPSIVGDVRVYSDGRREPLFLPTEKESEQRTAPQVHTCQKPRPLDSAPITQTDCEYTGGHDAAS